jgi:hypothetical protein
MVVALEFGPFPGLSCRCQRTSWEDRGFGFTRLEVDPA